MESGVCHEDICMTYVYFVRHAEPDFSVHDDITRPLTEKGLSDSVRIKEFFRDIPVDAFYSSPFQRSVSTILPAAESKQKEITLIHDFRERKVSDDWIDDFNSFALRQWTDHRYKLPGGESLSEVEKRNTAALYELLFRHDGGSIVVGSHGTSISTVIHHFDNAFGYDGFRAIQSVMPFIVLFSFEKNRLIKYRFIFPPETWA